MSTAEQHIDELQGQSHDTGNRLMRALLIAAIATSGISMVFSIGTAMASASGQQPEAQMTSGDQ